MSIRAAKFRDHWRKALNRKYLLEYVSLDYSGLRSLRDDQIKFSPGITAIVGGNGVGKSTLAHAIVDVLSGPDSIYVLRESEIRLSGSLLTATLADKNSIKQLTLAHRPEGRHASEGSFEHEFVWLDPSTMAMLCQQQILGDPTFSDLLEGIGSRVINLEELASMSYVVGKDYTKCTVCEIRDYGPFEVWPYFTVTCSGITYGSEDMGRGELALLTILWALDNLESNSIVILEEPETHVSARSQSAFMDLVAWFCATKGLWVIVTTHSPVVLQKLPNNHMRLLVSENGQSRLISSPKLHEIASIVGGGVAFKNLILVEDECANYFLQSILEKLEPDLRRQCAFVAMDGESSISIILNTLPKVAGWTNVIGCFDGDMREKLNSTKFHWPHIYLPGTISPESILRACVTRRPAADLAAELHVREQTISVSLATVAGLDPHDWLSNLIEHIGRTKHDIVRAMVQIWLRNEDKHGQLLVKDLKAALAL